MAAVLAGDAVALAAYPSRSEGAAATALAAVCAGWTRAEWHEALTSVCHIAGSPGDWMVIDPRGRRRSPADQDHRVVNTWAGAVAQFHRRPPATDGVSVMAELAEIRHAMDARPWLWGGQAGGGNRATLEALLAVAEEALRLDPTASIRRLAELSTVTASTIDRAIHRLVAVGWLRIEAGHGIQLEGWEDADGRRDGHAVARRIRIRIPDDLPEPLSDDELADPRTGELPTVRWAGVAVHDAFTWKGLGAVAGVLYARLSPSSPASAQLLATRVGYTPGTVRAHLRRLARHGLAVAGPHGWSRGGRDLDEVAVELDVAGTRAERAARHELQRARYLAYAIEFSNRRGYRIERGLYRPAVDRLPFSVERPPVALPPPRAA